MNAVNPTKRNHKIQYPTLPDGCFSVRSDLKEISQAHFSPTMVSNVGSLCSYVRSEDVSCEINYVFSILYAHNTHIAQ